MVKLHNRKPIQILLALILVAAIAATPFTAGSALAQEDDWNIETLDNNLVFATSIAVDSNNRPHISYICVDYDEETVQLKYAHWTGAVWEIEIVDGEIIPDEGDVGIFFELMLFKTSIALDSNNHPHISYISVDLYEESVRLKYARWTGMEWLIEIVDDEGIAFSPSLALDSNNFPHISYICVDYDEETVQLKYAHWTGAVWEIEIVDGEIIPEEEIGEEFFMELLFLNTSLALDSNNSPHISYICIDIVEEAINLKYAGWTGVDWIILTVDDEGIAFSPSLALDSNNYPHISYIKFDFDEEAVQLKYARWTGAEWEKETVDGEIISDGEIGVDIIMVLFFFNTSISLDSSNNPHISYISIEIAAQNGEEEAMNLKYARWTGTEWLRETVDNNGFSFSASLSLDGNNYPHLSYAGFMIPDSLHYATTSVARRASIPAATGTGLVTFSIDNGGIVALTALNIDSLPAAGKPAGVSFPHGLFSFNITNITPGSSVTVTISFPSPIPQNTCYWKYQNGNWLEIPLLSFPGTNTITIKLTDGGPGDADGIANGIIVDPGGPGIISLSAQSSVAQSSSTPERYETNPARISIKYLNVQPQQAQLGQPVIIYANIANSGDEDGKYTASLKINGELEETRTGNVGAHAAVPLKFEVLRSQPGTYTVDINGQQSHFSVIDNKTGAASPKTIALIGFIICIAGIIIVSALLIKRMSAGDAF